MKLNQVLHKRLKDSSTPLPPQYTLTGPDGLYWCTSTLVVQVALSGSTSRSSLWRTALGHRDDSRASMRKVSI